MIYTTLKKFISTNRRPSRKSLLIQFLINFAIAVIVLEYQSFNKNNAEYVPQMALFEIDEQTYRQWGSPILTPRDKLKSLIEKAEQGGANVVVVDIDLTWLSDGCFHVPGETPACSPVNFNSDVALGLYLQKLNEEFYEADKYDTPIILLRRTYRLPLDENGGLNTQAFLEKPYSFLEAYVKKEKNVFWTSTFEDGWQLAGLVCEDDHLSVVPSMPLLAAIAQVYSCEDSTRKAAYLIQEFKARLNAWAQSLPCDFKQGTTIAQICQKMDCPDLSISLSETHTIDLAQGTEKIVLTPPDSHLIENYRANKLLTANVDKQIVLIGVTHDIQTKKRDNVYLVANAVDTLLRFGQLNPPAYKTFILLVIMLTLIFAYYSLIKALIFAGIILFLLSGQMLAVALSLMTIQMIYQARPR
ncbi:hypothetical protein PN36_23110 [Candidatus Thiomargarita nelsonii]|uniref:Uncharacterized protein n=1 Tax=Candidatus Thiomargarita nelsonii TaxID=1003181 RepID=A0A4E0QZK9_9GAMM|nr:hypothetical protein PN36_23110 [Candidatus Thiomargarita nelsonii]